MQLRELRLQVLMCSIQGCKFGFEPGYLLDGCTQLVPRRHGCRQALLEIFEGLEIPLRFGRDPLRHFEITFENGNPGRRLVVVGSQSGKVAIGRPKPGA